MATEFKLSYTASDINTRLGKIDNLAEKSELAIYALKSEIPTDYLTEIPEQYVTESYVNDKVASKQDAIIGTAGQFVVIGADGKPTTETILIAEEETF